MPSPAANRPAPDVFSRRDDRIRGHTFRWTWTEGPVKGATHEHVFGEDGSVIWSCIAGPGKGHSAREKRYAVERISRDVYAVSYLSSTGFTLTAVMNFRDRRLAGFTSGGKNGKFWSPCRGTFEAVR